MLALLDPELVGHHHRESPGEEPEATSATDATTRRTTHQSYAAISGVEDVPFFLCRRGLVI